MIPIKEAVKFWVKLGFISFGGPAGQIAIMHTYLVDTKKWISDTKFMHALSYCMVLPGPEAQQLATYLGWMMHGTMGGLIAGIFFILPSIFIMLSLSILYVTFGKLAIVAALFAGLKPAVVAIVLGAFIKISSKSLIGKIHYITALLSFVAIYFFNIPFPIIILSTLFIAIALLYLKPELLLSKNNSTKALSEEVEKSYLINSYTVKDLPNFSIHKLFGKVSLTVLLWFVPITLLYFLTNDFAFWKQLTLFFSQAALVTFGGAYAVLPYVAQYSVEKMSWLSQLQMIDGLALGETTPGPLVMVLSFVGFMAGFNVFQGSVLQGTIGLLVTVFYTFLPCFLFIFAGAPVIEKTGQNPKIKSLLALITAAVVGVVLNLTIYFGQGVLFKSSQLSLTAIEPFAWIWFLISVYFLQKRKVNMILWIGISMLFGFINYYLA